MRQLLLASSVLVLAATARADVNCKFGDVAFASADVQTLFQYSASGERGKSGKVSFFRLMAHDGSTPSSSIELKTVDVMKPGDFDLAKEAGWTSVIRLHGKMQRVTGGKFSFTRFEVSGSRGHAAGTLVFKTASTEGSCAFDVDVQAVDRDSLPH
ncbi:hypothetical protein [Pelomonas cellulosilytica]|uniref:Uncharacterized protein n=1 Tax=Pelomonas cellulosilytica TaxID=2906762 RepID=A0ABS8Y0J1_9BURK|nr:hypothetical protein [Pelomonas sp. P8]MCE4556453.1 hypothetical protein [Pelomonas sp. P8]